MKYQTVMVAAGLVAILGCLDPPEMVPMTPPGVELKRMPPIPEGKGAQAIGEQPAQVAAQSTDEVLSKAMSPPTKVGETRKTASGLEYSTLKEGTGAEAKPGMAVLIHFKSMYTDGREFENSRTDNEPTSFRLGAGMMMKGIDEGVAGMRVGEIRKLMIPGRLAYVAESKKGVPPNTPIIVEVELLVAKEMAN
jgi:FKBP-type peptidyl-prolyl cis-trans isomerase